MSPGDPARDADSRSDDVAIAARHLHLVIPSEAEWRSRGAQSRDPLKLATMALALLLVLTACAHRGAPEVETAPKGHRERGVASWYGHPYHGRPTASGEIYDQDGLTAAHRTLPFGTVVRVTRRDTGARVTVQVNDRGPFIRGRIIDLSRAAAREIGLEVDGVAPVVVEVVGREEAHRPKPAPPPPYDAEDRCFWVQVGAFGDPDNARRVHAELVAMGERPVIIEAPGGLERVRVGPYDTERAADKALGPIRRRWPKAAVVPCG